jgi:hypothetical protein
MVFLPKSKNFFFFFANCFLGLGSVFSGMHYRHSLKITQIKQSLILSIFGWGFSLMIFSQSINFYFSLSMCGVVGFFLMRSFLIMNNTIQFLVENQLRARVLSLYTMTFLGTVPLGSLLFGTLTFSLFG